MTRRTKILLSGCLAPIFLIVLCAGVIYFSPGLLAPVLGRVFPNDTEQVLEDLADQQAEPAIDWTEIESNDGAGSTESSGDQLPAPAITVSESEVIRVRFRNQTAQVDPDSLGMSEAAEIVSAEGETSFVFEYNEENLNAFLLPAISRELPPELDGQIGFTNIDLVPGAIVINGEVDTGIIGSQPLVITVALGGDAKSLEIVGANVGGLSLDAVGAAPLEQAFDQAEQEINTALRDMAVVSSGGEELQLNTLFIGDNVMQAVFRN